MPKITHEALVTILRSDPKLLVDLVWPERQIDASSIHLTHTELVDVNLPERRADGVLLIGDEPRAPEWALVAEAQDCVDPKKRRRWPGYVTGVFGRHVCPVDLVVLTVDREVAAWAARPITAGRLPGALTFTPVVVGPDQIPRITDAEAARRSPELAVLSAAAHGDEPGAEALALAASSPQATSTTIAGSSTLTWSSTTSPPPRGCSWSSSWPPGTTNSRVTSPASSSSRAGRRARPAARPGCSSTSSREG